MDKWNVQLFDSSEFYNRRYKNFSTMIVIPVALLLVFTIISSLVATREVALKTTGEVQPNQIISDIQSTSSNKIILNNMTENMVVKKNQPLLRYSRTSNKARLLHLKNQQSNLEKQRRQLYALKSGIKANRMVFSNEDKFGYSQRLSNYLNQRNILEAKITKDNMDIKAQNEKIREAKGAIDKADDATAKKISEYEDIKEAVKNNKNSVSQTNSLTSTFEVYRQTIHENGNTDESKHQVLSEIQKVLDELREVQTSYATQRASSGAYIATDTSLDTQLKSLQTQELANIDKEATTLKSKLDELNLNIAIQNEDLQKSTISSPKSGVLHVVDEMKSKNWIATGTTIAQIYPSLNVGKTIHIITYINSEEMSSVHLNDWLKFTSKKEITDNLTLKCKISEISVAPEKTAKGSFFKVTAHTKVTKENKTNLRYGLEGSVSIITGKKTYFDYYKDKIIK